MIIHFASWQVFGRQLENLRRCYYFLFRALGENRLVSFPWHAKNITLISTPDLTTINSVPTLFDSIKQTILTVILCCQFFYPFYYTPGPLNWYTVEWMGHRHSHLMKCWAKGPVSQSLNKLSNKRACVPFMQSNTVGRPSQLTKCWANCVSQSLVEQTGLCNQIPSLWAGPSTRQLIKRTAIHLPVYKWFKNVNNVFIFIFMWKNRNTVGDNNPSTTSFRSALFCSSRRYWGVGGYICVLIAVLLYWYIW